MSVKLKPVQLLTLILKTLKVYKERSKSFSMILNKSTQKLTKLILLSLIKNIKFHFLELIELLTLEFLEIYKKSFKIHN
jgi:hypothetical protein